jgi:hypothetical protein
MTLMAETVGTDRPPDAEPVPQRRSAKPATVSASALAQHLDCSRTYIGKLEAEGVIQRQGDGFPLDASRVAYLRYLRRERQRSARSETDSAFTAAKTRLILMRVQEKERTTIPLAEAIAHVDEVMGVLLTHLGGMPAVIGGHDLALRRRVEQCVYNTRVAISTAASKLADERGEPRRSRGSDRAG